MISGECRLVCSECYELGDLGNSRGEELGIPFKACERTKVSGTELGQELMARIKAGKTYGGGGRVISNRTLEVDIGGRMEEMYLGILLAVE